MGLFDRTGSRLATRPALLLAADPGSVLLDTARLYDPEVRHWRGRLVFSNGVLLFGPVTVTSELTQEAGLPAGVSVAWYADAALQRSSARRSDAEKRADGERLVRGLAARLGGIMHPAPLQPKLALLASVYSEQPLAAEQVIETLQPYAGNLTVEDARDDSYSLSGKSASFYTAYWSPGLYVAGSSPPALGPLRKQRLHHWDLNTGTRADHAPHELTLRVGEAALALARHSGGLALDMLGFRISRPEDVLPGG
jgi:hypothetical protein